MSTQPEPKMFDAPALLVEARFRDRLLCARLLPARAGRGFTVGAARSADAPVDPRYLPAELPFNDNHVLVAASAAGFIVCPSSTMVARGERSSTRLRVACGEVVFDLTAAAPAPVVPRAWLRRGWGAEARTTGGVALGLLALLLVVRAVPADPHALSLDDVGRDVRLDIFRTIPPFVPPAPALRVPGAEGGGVPAAASGPRGAAGDRAAPLVGGRRATRGPAIRRDARAVAAYLTRTTMLALLDGAAFQAIVGEASALGSEADDVLAHLEGRTIAQAWGLGPTGTGGGGDTERAMLPGSGLRTIGSGGRRPGPSGYGDEVAELAPRRARAPDVSFSSPVVRGGLDKEIVRRVVRQHLNEVRYCYEEALPQRPTLAGRVVAQFTIAPTGRVLASALQSSSLGAPTVEACIVASTRRWLFPQPVGGGVVVVSYPFQLAPAGG
ncbi:MAG TPA: AgmX/PglI C-terminal domain-containing protein [Polyangia bacterium]|nr:AgmX/PglI C-terminal domain-containing protein [Polyangia bacterium]